MVFRKKGFGILISVLVALPLVGVSTQIVGQSAPDVTPTVSPLTAQAAPAATEIPASTSEVSALGSVEAASVIELQFQTSGAINGVYANVGDYVRAGEVLGRTWTLPAPGTRTTGRCSISKARRFRWTNC